MIGLLFSVLTVITWSLSDVSAKYAALAHEVNPLIFTCLKFFIGGSVLLVYSGVGKGLMGTLRNTQTWAYSLFLIAVNFFYLLALLYISATEAAILIQLVIPLNILAVWIFLQRKPNLSGILGSIVILGCFIYLSGVSLKSGALIGIFYITLAALTATVRAILAEVHTGNREAKTVLQRCRVTGIISIVTSVMFLVVTMLVAYILDGISPELHDQLTLFADMPTLQDFTHKATFFAGAIIGATLIPIGFYAFFTASVKYKSENVSTVLAFQPFFTFIFESTFVKVGLLEEKIIPNEAYLTGSIVIATAIIMLYFKHQEDKRGATPKKVKLSNKDDFELVNGALRFCEGDFLLASKKLGVSVEELEKIYEAKGTKGFNAKGDKHRIILRNYHRNIATADNLTGLANREAIISAMDGAFRDKISFTIAFIDLNKFKPINDTYGHEVGDYVLKEVSKNVADHLPAKHLMARLGGDEFVLMFRHTGKAEASELMSEVLNIIEKPIKVKGVKDKLEVSASYGIAEAGEDGNDPDKLLKAADLLMYDNKNGR